MKALVVILLLVSLQSLAQKVNPNAVRIFKAELYVQEVQKNWQRCLYQTIVWGWKADTICFALDQVRCFTCAKEVEQKYQPNDITILAVSHLNEKHSVRMVHNDDGFIIFITNLEKNYPHFVLSTKDICSRN